jgi:hypothetical protein
VTEHEEYASADDLAGSDELDVNAEDVTLPSGRKVRVRGLSRYELMVLGKNIDDPALVERRHVIACMVAPQLTAAQVEAWQKRSTAGGDFKVLSEKIRDLSGIAEGAQKSPVREDGSGA